MLSRLRPYLSFWAVCVVAIVVDVATKLLVVRHIPFGAYFGNDPARQPIMLFDRLWIVHVGNKGAAWGLGAEHDVRPFLILLALAVLALVWRWRKQLLRELQVGLFVGGTLGNVRDRLFGDHVIDFIDVHLPYYRFPAFNVADSCICVGVGLYIVMSYRHDRLRREAIVSHGGEDPPAGA
jgi:signal peptidase II